MGENGEDREAWAATDLVRIFFGKVEEQRLALKAKGRNLAGLGAADTGNAFSNETVLKSVRKKNGKEKQRNVLASQWCAITIHKNSLKRCMFAEDLFRRPHIRPSTCTRQRVIRCETYSRGHMASGI
jgi:hypothetical protein